MSFSMHVEQRVASDVIGKRFMYVARGVNKLTWIDRPVFYLFVEV